MKRSPSSCSSSSSSSCIESSDPQQQQKQETDDVQPKTKRVRAKKNHKQENSQINATKRSSIYRGVTRYVWTYSLRRLAPYSSLYAPLLHYKAGLRVKHRWTGRYEAHLWDKSTWNTIQNKRGRQIYLGAYDNEETAARTYDLAALKYWGPATILNFPIESYTKELEDMQKLSKEEYLASLRRRSSGFSRGVSKYRGVARHHHNGRWEARIGRVLGNKYLYLGTYSTQEEAAAAYDMAAIEYRGPNAVTNFDISNYIDILKKPKPATQIKQETPEESVKEQPNELLLKQEIRQEAAEEKPHEMIKQESPEEFTEAKPHQLEEKPLVQTKILDIEFGHSIEPQTMVVMDPDDQHEHPWDLCLDIGFNSLHIPLDERHAELPDLFNDIDFEDDIDLIFDGAAYEIDLNQDAMLGNTGCGLKVDALVAKEEKGLDATASPSLSPLSTTTSVSGEA